MHRRRFLIAGTLLLLVPSLSWSSFEAGLDATRHHDYEAALKEFRPLAEKGNAAAQYNMGLFYDKGLGVPQDPEVAAQWYLRAAKQGIPQAQVKLGAMFDNGQGVTQDYTQAARWYRLAAQQGFSKAQIHLGMMYYRGQGVGRDYVQAHMWLNLAGAKGDRNAARFRDILAAEMEPEQIQKAQKLAREWKPKQTR
jgi:uncharacterized protein